MRLAAQSQERKRALYHLFSNRKRTPSGILILLSIAFLLNACAVPTTPPTTNQAAPTTAAITDATDEALFPLTITDAAGQEFTFDAPPKIGCWWSGCTEVMADLGVVPHAASYNDTNENSAFFYPAGMPPHKIEDPRNPELWAAAEVDLLVMRVPADPGYDALKAAAPIFYLHHASFGDSSQTGYQGLLENLRIMGQVTGQPEAAAAAITRFDNVLANLKSLAIPETQAQTVAVLWDDTAYRTIDQTSPFCVTIAELGLGQCIEGPFWEEISAETFLAADPDWIAYQSVDGAHDERTDPVWAQLSAVKAGQVYDTMGYYYCCGARGLIHTLQEFAHFTLPEANIPAPGPWLDFDPLQSPLIQPGAVTTTATAAAGSLFPLTITDALGQAFTFATQPKLACDWYGCYETMADLGIVLHAAAMTPEMAEQPFYSPVGPPDHLIEDLSNPELWAATEMEVFLSRVPDDPYYDVFREMVPVFFLHHPSYGVSSETGYQAYIANARLLGQLSGQPEAAEAAITQFETMLANLRALSTPELAAQTVGILWSDAGYSGLATNNPFCVLLADVGLGRCMGESTGRFVEYNAEEVLALNPDLIIYMLEGGPSHTERTDPVWGELTAAKEGRVYDVIGTRYTCCSLRGLVHSFQEYVSVALPDAGIPAPGPVETFDPSQSPLVQADFADAQE